MIRQISPAPIISGIMVGKRTRAPRSSLQEASRFFMRQGEVYDTVRRLTQRLEEAGMDHAIVGGLAVVEHGYRRATEDVDVLVRRSTLDAFRERLVGRGYVPAFEGATRAFRDAQTGVRIEFLTTGDFPGDGKPKPVAFPDPADVRVKGEEFSFVNLETLVELKLASGLSAPHRLQDLADVQNLISRTKLPIALAEQLDPSVRDEYLRLWRIAEAAPPEE